jgi:hypothetical protein
MVPLTGRQYCAVKKKGMRKFVTTTLTILRGSPHDDRSPSKLGHSRQDAFVAPHKQRVRW